MTLRRPAAHLRRAPGWRRSGDESCWESLIPEGERSPGVSPPTRTPRPQSAIEGGHLDSWLEHLQTLQSQLRAPQPDQEPAFNERTTSAPVLNKEPSGRAWRQKWFPSFSRGSTSPGGSSLCESLLGSQESLQTGFGSSPEHGGNWERAHVMQAPSKENTQLSYLAPVKIGWLPIQRRVMMVDDAQKQEQIKLKQPITPTFLKNEGTSKTNDGEVERSHTSPSAGGTKTQQTPDHISPIDKQVPKKLSLGSKGGERPAGWQALKSRWNANRVLAFPGSSKSKEHPKGTGSETNKKSLLTTTTSTEALKHSPLNQTTSTDLPRPPTLPQGTIPTVPCKPLTPWHRPGSSQPVKAIIPMCETNRTLPSHIQTTSTVTTLIPQNKTGFSSITISSRKVCRSASLPGSGASTTSSQSSRSPSPPMNQNPGQVLVQRKATIVKVTEKRVVSGPDPNTAGTGATPSHCALDTVVRRRKATIIKVTEHRESYSTARTRCGRPENRHSYTEGLFQNNIAWSQGKPSHGSATLSPHPANSKPNSAVVPKPVAAEPEKNLHRSTLSLFVSNPPAIAAPASSEVVGRQLGRPHRPQSWYGDTIGHAEPRRETVTQPAARKWSFALPQETSINPVHPGRSLIIQKKTVKEAGQFGTDTIQPNGGIKEKEDMMPRPVDTMSTAPPCLTLIKNPDPHCNQSPEEVLALNAAAVIANIKLQRQLSKKKTPNGDLEKDSAASPPGNADEGKCRKSPSDQSQAQRRSLAGPLPLSPGAERSTEPVSLQQALTRSRPDFISRSQGRVRRLERKARERRELSDSAHVWPGATLGQRRALSAQSTSLNENPFRPRDRDTTWKNMQSKSKQTLGEVRRQNDDAKKRDICLSNRQRVELFKKKLLAQVLQKSAD